MPGCAVEEDSSVDPAFVLGPDAYPCVVSGSGIAEDHFAGNALASEHTGHKRGIVEADSLGFTEDSIENGKVTAFYGGGFIGIVADVFYNVVINSLDLFEGIGNSVAKVCRLFDSLAALAVVYVLVGTKERSKFVLEGDFLFDRKNE